MKIPWTAILSIITVVWRWLAPSNKWEGKREAARKKLKEVDDALEKVTLKIVDAKNRGDIVAACPLDIEREQLLKKRSKCESEYLYYGRLCDKKG